MSRLSVSLGFVPEKTVEKGVLRKQYLIDLRDMNRPDVTRATAALLTAVFLIAMVVTTPSATAPDFEATLYVDPPSTDAPVSTHLTVTVSIRDVVDLYTWQFRMNFDPSLLECTGATEGPFLKSGGPTVWPSPAIDNVVGTILVGCSLLVPPGVSGSGVLAYVTFHCKGVGHSDLVFQDPDTFLLDSNLNTIPRQAIGGGVTQRPTPPVGGATVPVSTIAILAPWMGLSALVGAVTAVVVIKKRRES